MHILGRGLGIIFILEMMSLKQLKDKHKSGPLPSHPTFCLTG